MRCIGNPIVVALVTWTDDALQRRQRWQIFASSWNKQRRCLIDPILLFNQIYTSARSPHIVAHSVQAWPGIIGGQCRVPSELNGTWSRFLAGFAVWEGVAHGTRRGGGGRVMLEMSNRMRDVLCFGLACWSRLWLLRCKKWFLRASWGRCYGQAVIEVTLAPEPLLGSIRALDAVE
jgi:hypothetical protein